MKKFTVWVGGVEVTDYLLTKQEAKQVALEYISQGYTDVKIQVY
jgi:hypothetical protein